MASVKYVRFLTNFATNYQGEASGLPGTGLQERGLPGAGGIGGVAAIHVAVCGWLALDHWMLATWQWYRKTRDYLHIYHHYDMSSIKSTMSVTHVSVTQCKMSSVIMVNM